MAAELIKRGKKLDLLPTGSTLLNLACADSPFGGYSMGSIVNLVSDSDVGKSILAMTTLADIASKKAYDHYRLIYVAVEPLNFNVELLFGKRLKARLEVIIFETIEELYVAFMKWMSERRAMVLVVDSYDALSVKEEVKKGEAAAKRKAGPTKDDNMAGYDSAKKTKQLKTLLRFAKTDLPKSKSLMIIISQVIQNMEPGMFKQKYVITGGQPIKHFPLHRIWLKPEVPIEVMGCRIGRLVRAEVFKNHLTGKHRDVVFPIFEQIGVDDLASCVGFLIDLKYWKDKIIIIGDKKTSGINCPELNFQGTTKEIVKHIETNNLYQELYRTVTKVWMAREEELKLDRKPRF
jgi:RecA/RadA recombinase